MCICGPESAAELLQHHEQIRVATKYPRIAKDYFYNKKLIIWGVPKGGGGAGAGGGGDYQAEWFHRTCADRWTIRGNL